MTVTRRAAAAAVFSFALALGIPACSSDPEYAKQEYLKSGDRYFDQKKYSEAIVQYRNALQQDAKFGPARYKLAQSYELLGDHPNAYREYIRAADASPDRADVQVKAGDYLLAAGQFEDARGRAEKALKKDPKNVAAQILLGNALVGLRDLDAALKELEEAVKLDPRSASAFASLGRVQLATGSAPEAEASFRRAVATNPKMAGAHMALAQFLWASGRWADAERSLIQALSLEPGNLLAHRALAALYTVRGRVLEAEPHLKALADADTLPSAPMKIALADYYVSINRWEDAMKVLEELSQRKDSVAAAGTRRAMIDYTRKGRPEGNRRIDEVLAGDPKNVPALLVKSRFLANERKFDEALKLATSAAAADPRSIHAHFLLGTLNRAKGQHDEAIRAFNEVLKLNPRAVAAQVNLAELNLGKGAKGPALQLAQDAVRQLPSNPAAQLTLVRSLVANGQLAKAESVVNGLMVRFPSVALVHHAAGTVALAKHDTARARRAFVKASEIDPGNYDALAALAMVDFAERKPEAARVRVEQQLAKTPNDSRVLMLAASVYVASDVNRAEQLLRKAIEADASNLEAFGMLAQLYMSQKKLPEARASLEEIVRARPDAAGPQTMLAILYEADGNRAEAQKRYERVMQVDSTAAVAANNLAFIYAEHGGNLDQAFQLAQVAKQKLPDNPAVADTLGWIYVKKEMATLAIPQLQQAVSQMPKNANSLYHLGVALAMAGQPDKGRQTLERALSLNLAPHSAAEARKLLAKLQS